MEPNEESVWTYKSLSDRQHMWNNKNLHKRFNIQLNVKEREKANSFLSWKAEGAKETRAISIFRQDLPHPRRLPLWWENIQSLKSCHRLEKKKISSSCCSVYLFFSHVISSLDTFRGNHRSTCRASPTKARCQKLPQLLQSQPTRSIKA